MRKKRTQHTVTSFSGFIGLWGSKTWIYFYRCMVSLRVCLSLIFIKWYAKFIHTKFTENI